MAIPVARVYLAMAHAALPGLLPTPPKCMMLPLLPAPPGAAVILHPSSPPRPSRADAAARWDAHKTKHGGGAASPSSAGRCSLDTKSDSPGRASSCDSWVSSNKKTAGAATSTSTSSSSSSGSSSGRADSNDRWDAHKKKKPASPAASSSASSSATASRIKRHDGSKRPNSRASSSSSDERWDAHKNGGRRAPRADELNDDGERSTGSNDDVESSKAALPPPPLQQRGFYAGPGFITSPEQSMLPMPSFMIRVK